MRARKSRRRARIAAILTTTTTERTENSNAVVSNSRVPLTNRCKRATITSTKTNPRAIKNSNKSRIPT